MSGQFEIPKDLPPRSLFLLPTENPWPPSSSKTRISILDSSFNPPTRAHLALASINPTPNPGDEEDGTSHLLLFSTTNVEKKLKPSDPNIQQRLHMISLLLPYLPKNTAIGLINEPTFVGKSSTIHHHLSQSRSLANQAELSFIIGTDTLTRFFDPRFYGSFEGGMVSALAHFFDREGSILLSARRGGQDEREIEERVCGRDKVARLVNRRKLVLVGTGKEEWVSMSSTNVREAVKAGQWDKVGTLVVPEIVKYIREQGLYRE